MTEILSAVSYDTLVLLKKGIETRQTDRMRMKWGSTLSQMPLMHASELGSASDLSELHNNVTLSEITEESLPSEESLPIIERHLTAPIIHSHDINEPNNNKPASSITLIPF